MANSRALHQKLITATLNATLSISCGYFVLHCVSVLCYCTHEYHILEKGRQLGCYFTDARQRIWFSSWNT